MIVNDIDVKQAIWYTVGFSCIGIVSGEDVMTGEFKRYIGIGSGKDERSDIKNIVTKGAPFHIEVFKV